MLDFYEDVPKHKKHIKEEVFHHYLPQNTLQHAWNFNVIDEETKELQSVQEFAVKKNVLKTEWKSGATKAKLLSEDIETMLAKLKLEKEAKVEVKKAVDSEDEDFMPEPTQHQAPTRELWVDKYRATSFFDLLTREQINRNVLTWLKSWDEVVFP